MDLLLCAEQRSQLLRTEYTGTRCAACHLKLQLATPVDHAIRWAAREDLNLARAEVA